MKLAMLVSMAGPGVSLSPGEPYECSEDEAERLIAAGFAAPAVDAKPKMERAVARTAKERRG